MIDPAHHPELLTPAEMAEADRTTIAGGVPGIVLMERAGAAVAEEAVRVAPSAGRIAILCGPATAATVLSRRGCSPSAATASK
jgi:NAD(P)H-hydrate repair Nnr-like enzyme with NAD(P)H-hydrate epimerase domain